jgi:integrase/recombinase XerD
MTYAHAVEDFLAWIDRLAIPLPRIEPVHVAAYVELITRAKSAPTVKQHLAAIRMLFDWLVTGQVVPFNPASSVRGPKHSVKRGKTPVLTAEEERALSKALRPHQRSDHA